MEKEEGASSTHVLVLPFPAQGHMNPLFQFSNRLVSKGLKVTLATTIFIAKTMKSHPGSLIVDPISDGFDDGGWAVAEDMNIYKERFEAVGSRTLAELVEKYSHDCPVKCLIYDSHIPWALDVAKKLGIVGASFFTQSCAVDLIYYNVSRGLLSTPVQGPTVTIPGLPLLEVNDLPSFVYYALGSYATHLSSVLSQFSNFEKADWLLVNTFDKLEDEVVQWMSKKWRIKTIGPTVPSMYLDKRMEGNTDYGINLFHLDTDPFVKWLNTKETSSVVYVSFGSLAELGEEQMEELAWGLKNSNSYFLWVVRASEETKLPSKFVEETSEKGMVVTWCPQLEVLAHRAVGCFMTHCGWNSTLEALSLGVPMVAMPQWTDQTTNGKFVVDIWEVGLRARVDEKGIVRREDIELCIKEVMEGDKGKEIKRNVKKWKELAKEAVDEGGSSDKNIEDFIAGLVCD
ncbi:hypothetical protein HHK36_020030 [Tetracentron sinense]|uniref:Glycosyltransferase n=1 Tax=Tetracentron sinense TaxID=13715 RepID=A0A834YYR2_TETSI|nr:hypothetical protein HHK36_020030 [Tetracentron sinense]